MEVLVTMVQTVIRPIGPNTAGIPEDRICEIIIPLREPEKTTHFDPKTDEYPGSDDRKQETTNSGEKDAFPDSHPPRSKAFAM
jgi:hypothetical protein